MKPIKPHQISFSVAQVAEVTGLGISTVYKNINSKNLKAKKVGGRTLVLRRDLDSWLEETDYLDSKDEA